MHGRKSLHTQADVRRRPPSQTLFFSLRFGEEHGVVSMARELQAALDSEGVGAVIIDMKAGGDIDTAVFSAIEYADTFVVFGSKHYGQDTGNPACTYYESNFAQSLQKRIILIRMIPFDEKFEQPQARFMFGLNKLEIPWLLGTPMPADLPEKVAEAMELLP